MQWKTVVLDSNNWAIFGLDNKQLLHWAIKDRPWYTLRTFQFNTPPETYPVQIKSMSWTTAEINSGATPDKGVILGNHLIAARVKLFYELQMRLNASMENMGVADNTETLLQLHGYLVSKGIIEGSAEDDSVITYQNKIALLSNLENIKKTIIDLGLAARTKESFDAARKEMERLFFTNILL